MELVVRDVELAQQYEQAPSVRGELRQAVVRGVQHPDACSVLEHPLRHARVAPCEHRFPQQAPADPLSTGRSTRSQHSKGVQAMIDDGDAGCAPFRRETMPVAAAVAP